jgi:hypothetical protein
MPSAGRRYTVRKNHLRDQRGTSSPTLPKEQVGGGGRNARATSTRSRAFPMSPGNSPSRITGCRWLRRNRPASVGVHVRCTTLWDRTLPVATEKHGWLVQKLWTMRLPCGRLRKSYRFI